MLATYPEVFAGGAVIGGLPYRTAKTAFQAMVPMKGHGGPSDRRLGALVRDATAHNARWPSISVWHGDSDTIVDPSNAEANGVKGPRTLTEEIDGHPRRVWRYLYAAERICDPLMGRTFRNQVTTCAFPKSEAGTRPGISLRQSFKGNDPLRWAQERAFRLRDASPRDKRMVHFEDRMLVVVGASAGGMQALKELVAQFPKDFPAPVFIVSHMSPDTTGEVLVRVLDEAGPLRCRHATDQERFQAGKIYVAPSDRHMLIAGDKFLITKGARENRSRPAIDPLFRSAAIAYGNRVIGVILTGYLDDGTSGMRAIKRCGGICIAQDPDDADHPDMPRSVIVNVGVDHCLPIADMGDLLSELVRVKPAPGKPPPEDIVIEARIAQRVLSDLPSVETLGEQVPYNCPDCGGVLWQIKDGDFLRYRCHTGHAFTSAVLLAVQSAKIEETLWTAMRMFEERQNLMATMKGRPDGNASKALSERSKEAQVHIDRIRAMLKASNTALDVMETGEKGTAAGRPAYA